MSLEGRLEDMGLADIFQIISLSKRSGVLTLIRKEGTGRLVFTQGQIIFASSDTRSRLGYTLVKKGIIQNDDLEYALRIQKGRGSKKPIGTILLEMGSLSQETFETELKIHIVSVISDLLSWDTGSFYFELGNTSTQDVASNSGFNTESIILEAFKLQDEEERDKKAEAEKAKMAETQSVQEDSQEQPSKNSATQTSVKERRDLSLLSSMIPELAKHSSNSDLTLMILRFASELMSRAIIFLVRKDEIVGLGQFGFEMGSKMDQETIRSIKIPMSEPSIFKDVAAQKSLHKGPIEDIQWNRYLIDISGGKWPKEAIVVPIVCEGQSIAVLYADNIPGDEPIGETEGLESFILVVEVSFSKALLERKIQNISPPGP